MTPMDFGAARERVKQIIAGKKPAAQSRSGLEDSSFRDHMIRDEGQRSERFRHALNDRPTVEFERDGERKSYEWNGSPDLLTDIAKAGFSFGEPKLRPREDVAPESQLGREVLANYMRHEDFARLRPRTEGNATASIFGSLLARDTVEEMAQTQLAEHVARSEEMREQSEAKQKADDLMDRLRKQARDDVDEQGTVQQGTRRQIKQALKQGEQATGALKALLDEQEQSTMLSAAKAVGRAAAEAAAEAGDALGQLPGTEPGEPTNLSPDEQIELAEQWAKVPRLAELARQLGRRFRRMEAKRKTRVKGIPEQIVGVTAGADLDLVLEEELARAVDPHPALRATFVKDFAEENLLELEMVGRAPAMKGPIVCVHDGSGSMSGDKFTYASALCIALLKFARRDKRTYGGVEFGSSGQSKSWLFPSAQPVDPRTVLDYATHFFSGGTDTATGLREAVRIMAREQGFKEADLVLIGDGQDRYEAEDQRLVGELRRMGVRIHGITIDTGSNPYFEQACEYHTDIRDLAGTEGDEAADRLAQNIA